MYDIIADDLPSLTIYSGDCNNLEEYVCIDLNVQISSNDTLYYSLSDPLLAGTTIFLKAFEKISDTLELCVQSFDVSDLNVICENAQEIFISGTECDPALTIQDSLSSEWQTSHNACVDVFNNQWFKINIPGDTRIAVRITLDTFHYPDHSYEVFKGDCEDLVITDCDVFNVGDGTYIIVIENYEDFGHFFWLRFGCFDTSDNRKFTICAREFEEVDNEICESATEIEFSSFPECGRLYNYDLNGLLDTDVDSTFCEFTVKDVWFIFDDGDSIDAILINMYIYNFFGIQFTLELYNVSNCNNLSLVNCEDTYFENINKPNHLLYIPSSEYSTWYIKIGIGNSFYPVVDLCFSQIAGSLHDDCQDAKLIDVNDDCIEFSNIGASVSNENFCSTNEDVWLKFIYEGQDFIEIEIKSLNNLNLEGNYSLSFFRRACDDLEPIECNISSDNDAIQYVLKILI